MSTRFFGAPSGIREEQSDGIVSLSLGKVNHAFPSVRLLMARANVRRDPSRVHGEAADAQRQESLNKQEKTSGISEV